MASALMKNSKISQADLLSTCMNKGFIDTLRSQLSFWSDLGIKEFEISKIYIVGSGPLPQTQIYLSSLLGSKIVCVERDARSAEISAALQERMGYTNVETICADGSNVRYSDAEHVILATMVDDKKEVAAQVYDSCPDDCFLTIRTPVGAHALWRRPVDLKRISEIGWEQRGTLSPEGSTVQSLIFQK
ncbi:hypothetical protein BV379_03005 [Rhodovulum sulfidophilum]|nr:hypothetical protein BV379_03005 [Rhodovulum sulfidophilum]